MNCSNLYRYHELKKRLEEIEKKLDNWLPECIVCDLEKEKKEIYEELFRMQREKLV